ncbi:MAG: chemotaxis protein CheB, partial [Verrucomicrobiota bacterium]
MVPKRFVVIGGSAGGIEALIHLVRELPPALDAALFVVIHVARSSPRMLPSILNRQRGIVARYPEHGERIRGGCLYVAPPDYHMEIIDQRIALHQGPRENRHRPAVDPLFRTAARAFGPAVIGVILTGYLDDGTEGLMAVRDAGGITVVQDPVDAAAPCMPRSALAHVAADYCTQLKSIPALLIDLLNGHPAPMGKRKPSRKKTMKRPKDPLDVQLSCPECGGPMNESVNGNLLRYRYTVGHSFSPESLLDGQSRTIESAIDAARRTMLERAALLKRLSSQFERESDTAQNFLEKARELEAHSVQL